VIGVQPPDFGRAAGCEAVDVQRLCPGILPQVDDHERQRAVGPQGGVEGEGVVREGGLDQLCAESLVELVDVVGGADGVDLAEQPPAAIGIRALQGEVGDDLDLLADQAAQHIGQPQGIVERVRRGLMAKRRAPVRIDLGDGYRQIAAGDLPDQRPQVGDDALPFRGVRQEFLDGSGAVHLAGKGVAVDGDDVHPIAVGPQEFGHPVAAGAVLGRLGEAGRILAKLRPQQDNIRVDGQHGFGNRPPLAVELPGVVVVKEVRLVADGPVAHAVALLNVSVAHQLGRLLGRAVPQPDMDARLGAHQVAERHEEVKMPFGDVVQVAPVPAGEADEGDAGRPGGRQQIHRDGGPRPVVGPVDVGADRAQTVAGVNGEAAFLGGDRRRAQQRQRHQEQDEPLHSLSPIPAI